MKCELRFIAFVIFLITNTLAFSHQTKPTHCASAVLNLPSPLAEHQKIESEADRDYRDAFQRTNSSRHIYFERNDQLASSHIHRGSQRFPQNARTHVVIFDNFGSTLGDSELHTTRVEKLSQKNEDPNSIEMGSEAFAPTKQLRSIEEAVSWMQRVLLNVRGRNYDQRPLVILARGPFAEVARLVLERDPSAASMLVLENPTDIHGKEDLNWAPSDFKVPTKIISGTHASSNTSTFKQKLFDLSQKANTQSKSPEITFTEYLHSRDNVFESDNSNLAYDEFYRSIYKHIFKEKVPSDDPLTSSEEFIRIGQTQGIGQKRYHGLKPQPTIENTINAIQGGSFYWEQIVIFVERLEDIPQHQALLAKPEKLEVKPLNHIMYSPLYATGSSHPLVKKMRDCKDEEEFKALLKGKDPQGVFREILDSSEHTVWADENNDLHNFDKTELYGLHTEDSFESATGNNAGFVLYGWSLPRIRGVMDLEEATKSSIYNDAKKFLYGSYINGKKVNPGLEDEGFRWGRNENLSLVLKKLRNMKRVGQSDNQTRFLDPVFVLLIQKLYELGLLHTVELYDSKGELVSGTIIVKIGNLWSPETVFYPHEITKSPNAVNNTNDVAATSRMMGIDYAKVVTAKVIDLAIAEGHTKLDVQVVSPLSKLYGAKYIPTDTAFLPMLRDINENWEAHLAAFRAKQKAADEAEAQQSAALAARLQELQPQIDEVNKRHKLDELKADYERLLAEYETKKKAFMDYTGIKVEGKESPETIARAMALPQYETMKNAAQEARKAAKKANDAYTKAQKRADTEIEELKKTPQEVTLDRDEIIKQIATLETKLTNARKILSDAQVELAAAMGDKDQNSKITPLETKIKAMSKTIGGFEKKIKSLQEQLATLR